MVDEVVGADEGQYFVVEGANMIVTVAVTEGIPHTHVNAFFMCNS